MNLKQITKEKVEEFEELTRYIKDISVAQYDNKGVNVGYIKASEVVQQFLTQAIEEAVRTALESVREEVIPKPKMFYNKTKNPWNDCLSEAHRNLEKMLKEVL